MSRWEYDTVFYRVFCITLLGVGFTFTVILTNVFVDIDGLLSNKDEVKPTNAPEQVSHELPALSRVVSVNMLPDDKSEETYDDKDYPDSDDLYRNKRSLDNINNLYKTLENVNARLPIIKPDLETFKRNLNVVVQNMSDNLDAQNNATNKEKEHNIVIKTVIDITASTNDKSNKENDWNARNKINGSTKVIYNGNILKFGTTDNAKSTNSIFDYNKKQDSNKTFHILTLNQIDSKINNNVIKSMFKSKKTNPSYFQKVIYDYLKAYKFEPKNSEHQQLISKKRLKRHVKIRFKDNKTTSKPKTKNDDDELFVEIETHFNSKGTKGEKKKKLIRELIEKIQRAIHSDQSSPNKNKSKHSHIKKRLQNPLSSKNTAILLNKLILPIESLAHRHLEPISKAVHLHEDMPYVSNILDHNYWQKSFYDSPRFFSKFINSAEMNTYDVDYNKVMKHNGIPQRLQKPLNTDMSDEVFLDTKVIDFGNIKFLMKDVDGSGFTIGFNQYTDEAPDSEAMKLFSGLENIIQTYHQQYDQENTPHSDQQVFYDSSNKNITPEEVYQNRKDIDKSDQHFVQRRSIQGSDETEHIANHYRVVSGDSVLPYKNYEEIVNTEKGQVSHVKNVHFHTPIRNSKKSFILDENVFEKDLKPSEIFSISDFFQRRKRSLKVKKISNLRIKTKMNRFLNTKKMASKIVYKNNKKRSKRQIDKIRIIARDIPQQRTSEEENVFAESNEKILADRALIREIDLPDLDPNDRPESIEHYDIMSSLKVDEPSDIVDQWQKLSEDHYDIYTPYVYESSPFESSNIFSRRARHNSLMSKYPHIIMEKESNNDAPVYENGEEYTIEAEKQQKQYNLETTTEPIIPTMIDISALPNDQEINDFIAPPNSNYRLSVKIRPKNTTGMSGYKEIHTSINKSYNKDGLMYTSLVNVSQLSKVEKLKKNITRKRNDEIISEQDDALKQQKDMIKAMIQQHKHRLDQQLKHLQMERMKLESIDSEIVNNITEPVQINETTVQPKKERKSNQGGGKDKKKSKSETATVKTTLNTPNITTPSTTTTKLSTEYVHPTVDDHLKSKMIRTIERNENITNELLKKIAQNTGVLEKFLGKLIQTIEAPSKLSLEEAAAKTSGPWTNNVRYHQIYSNVAPDYNLPFNFEDFHYMPNMFRNVPKQANKSLGIPFVYAVQNPYGAFPNKDMASLVYHGHIHTNAMNENNFHKRDNMQKRTGITGVLKGKSMIEKKNSDSEFWKPKPGEKIIHNFIIKQNSSKFFLDENQNDFKIPLLSNNNGTKAS